MEENKPQIKNVDCDTQIKQTTSASLKIGIVGSRRRNTLEDKKLLGFFLRTILQENEGKEISFVSGGCKKGADHFAVSLAKFFSVKLVEHLPDKTLLPENPQRWDFTRINHARNTLIAEGCDFLVALPADDRTGGTEDTIKKAKSLGKKVFLL